MSLTKRESYFTSGPQKSSQICYYAAKNTNIGIQPRINSLSFRNTNSTRMSEKFPSRPTVSDKSAWTRNNWLNEKVVPRNVDPVPSTTAKLLVRPAPILVRTASLPAPKIVPVTSSSMDKPKKRNFLYRMLSFNSKKVVATGYALILNHQTFDVDGISPQKGSQHDVNKLEAVFKVFNIETHVKIDLTLSEIEQKVKQLTQTDMSKYQCFILVILTHGKGNDFYAKDRKYDVIKVIEDPLLLKNKSLVNKPKIFLFQRSLNENTPSIQTDSAPSTAVLKRNIFKCYASHYHRSKNCATVFIEKLSRELKSKGKYLNIYDLMMRVNREVCKSKLAEELYILSTMVNPFSFSTLLNNNSSNIYEE